MTLDDELLTRHGSRATLTATERARLRASLGADAPTPVRERAQARWPVALAVAAVLLCVAGPAVWRASRSGDHAASAQDDAGSTCPAILPASWDAARSVAPLRLGGHDAVPVTDAPVDAMLLAWHESPGSTTYGLREQDGGLVPIASFPDAGEQVRGGTTDGADAVFAEAPDSAAAADRILLVDTGTGARRELLAAAPMPAGWVVRTDAVLQDGSVYWGATPSGDDSRGIVIRYSVADDSYRVVARPDRFPEVDADVRGVAWPGGAVARTGLPSRLNPILDDAGEPVDRLVTDGSAYAWQDIAGDQTLFHWVDAHDQERTFQVTIGAEHDGAILTAVSGPFLFFHVNQASGTESVLDTRTGALAPLPRDELAVSYAGGYLFSMSGGSDYHEYDTAALPPLTCG